MNDLEKRRKAARVRNASKTFNLKWVSDTLDEVMVELSEYSDRVPEIAAALETVLAAKRLVKAYSNRMLDTPYKDVEYNKALSSEEVTRGLLSSLLSVIVEIKDGMTENHDLLKSGVDNANEWEDEGTIPSGISDVFDDILRSYAGVYETLREASNTIRSARKEVGGKRYVRSEDRYGDFFQ